MNGFSISRRNFLRNSSFAIAGGALLSGGCSMRPRSGKCRAVLWVGGFAHDFDSYAEIMTEFLPKYLNIDIEVVTDGRFLDSSNFDVIIMNHCFKSAEGVLTDAQKAMLLEKVQNGTGVVVVHASYYSFPEWEDIRKLYGATFIKHDKVDVMLDVRVTDKDHPVTSNLGDTFETHSELYQSTPLTEDCRVLAVAKEKGTDIEYPSVWTKNYGRGRVAVILPAHWPDSYEKEPFQQLIANSVSWVFPSAF